MIWQWWGYRSIGLYCCGGRIDCCACAWERGREIGGDRRLSVRVSAAIGSFGCVACGSHGWGRRKWYVTERDNDLMILAVEMKKISLYREPWRGRRGATSLCRQCCGLKLELRAGNGQKN